MKEFGSYEVDTLFMSTLTSTRGLHELWVCCFLALLVLLNWFILGFFRKLTEAHFTVKSQQHLLSVIQCEPHLFSVYLLMINSPSARLHFIFSYLRLLQEAVPSERVHRHGDNNLSHVSAESLTHVKGGHIYCDIIRLTWSRSASHQSGGKPPRQQTLQINADDVQLAAGMKVRTSADEVLCLETFHCSFLVSLRLYKDTNKPHEDVQQEV